jgi:broad specificity phosphatase PhoE
VYSSPLSRARDTAEAIAAPHGLHVVTVDHLREAGLGVWEGLTLGEVEARFGSVIESRRRDPLNVVPDGGETLPDLAARGMRVVKEIVARHADLTVAAVAHGALNRVIVLSALGAPLSSYWRVRQDNAAVNILEFRDGRARVSLMNETAHLDDLRAE